MFKNSRKLLSIILILILFLSIENVYAAEINSEEIDVAYVQGFNIELGVSEFFKNFIDDFLKNEDRASIFNNSEQDVKIEYLNIIRKLYNNNNYKAIQDLIINKKLNLSFTIIENNKMSIGSNTVHNRAYHYADDNQNISQPREWATEMTGTYSYDSSTNKAISASKPSIKLIALNM